MNPGIILTDAAPGLLWELEPEKDVAFEVVEVRSKRILTDPAAAGHILIEGDNYNSLQYLQNEYKGKVDLIYIDPPYNTGFKQDQEGLLYHDRRVETHHQYKHSAWLNFMYHRLSLAKELMTEQALIFISIDENEFAHLKLLCDQLFDESNFINYLVWKKRGTGGQVKDGAVITQTEFILIYAKGRKLAKLNKQKNPTAGSSKWRDFRKSGGQWQQRFRPRQHFPFYFDEEKQILSLTKDHDAMVEILPFDNKGIAGFWENGIETAQKRLSAGELKAKFNKKSNRYKVVQWELATSLQNAGNFIDIPSVNGNREIRQFDLEFNNVKPLSLVKHILALGLKPDSVVLDFFAGSGTTAQAVMEINKESGLKHTCIFCTNNENDLCNRVTYPRLQRALQGYTNAQQKTYVALNQNLTYYKVIENKP